MSDWKVVKTVGTEEKANLIAGFLEAEGIPSRIESLLFHQEPTNFGALSEIRIHVGEGDFERALAILEKRDSSSAELREGELAGEVPGA